MDVGIGCVLMNSCCSQAYIAFLDVTDSWVSSVNSSLIIKQITSNLLTTYLQLKKCTWCLCNILVCMHIKSSVGEIWRQEEMEW